MAVATPETVEIFEWKGRHFDAAQELKLKGVSALSFFLIDNILYLATAYDKEINGRIIRTTGKFFKFMLFRKFTLFNLGAKLGK